MQSPPASEHGNHGKALVVCPDAPLAIRLRTALQEHGFEDVSMVTQYPPAGVIASVVQRDSSQICFLDVASDSPEALRLIPEAAAVVPVVALNPHNDADLILRCLRHGACEFLADATPEQVASVLERLARLRAPAAPPKSGLVYSVLPGKSGCGASTLAAYLAFELKRTAGRVLLVDLDCTAASIAFLLKLKADFHLDDVVRDWNRLDEDLWGRMAVPCRDIDVVIAPENPTTGVEVGAQAARGLLAFWRQHYDAVVLDLPGARQTGFEFAALSDEVLLVTTNELAALHATRRTMECLEKASADRTRWKLVVTRYTPSTGLLRDDVQTALRLEPYALLSNDYEAVQAAVTKGEPIASGSYFARSLRALAERLAGKEKTAKKRSSWFGLFPVRG